MQLDTQSLTAITNDIKELMASWGNGARAFIMIGYKQTPEQKKAGDKQAHVFVAEQIEGRTYFAEPQDPDLLPNSPGVYSRFAEAAAAFLMRVDNLEFSMYAKDRLEHRDGRLIS